MLAAVTSRAIVLAPLSTVLGLTRGRARPVMVAVTASLLAGVACTSIAGTEDPESLGYGSARTISTRYDPAPMLPRKAPQPWTPPRPGASVFAGNDAPFSPEVIRLCQHIGAVQEASAATAADAKPEPDAKADDAPAAEPAQDRLETVSPHRCRARLRGARVFRSVPAWRELATCLEATDAPEAIATCEAQNPPPFAVDAEHPLEAETCLHVLSMTTVEELGANPELRAEDIADFSELFAECVDTLVQNAEEDPDASSARLRCILEATNSDAAGAC